MTAQQVALQLKHAGSGAALYLRLDFGALCMIGYALLPLPKSNIKGSERAELDCSLNIGGIHLWT